MSIAPHPSFSGLTSTIEDMESKTETEKDADGNGQEQSRP